jgi:hypothetical protein
MKWCFRNWDVSETEEYMESYALLEDRLKFIPIYNLLVTILSNSVKAVVEFFNESLVLNADEWQSKKYEYDTRRKES